MQKRMFDTTSTIRATMQETEGLSAAIIATLSGISETKMSKFLNGSGTPTIEESKRLSRVCGQIRQLQSILSPIPIDWRRSSKIKKLFDGIDDGSISAYAVEIEPEPKV